MSNQKGLFSIEVLAAMLVSMPVLLALTIFIAQSCKHYLLVGKDYLEIHNALAVYEHIKTISDDLDRHTFELYPRIHHGGKISFTDGQINSISQNSDLQPLNTSDAISYARLNLPSMLEIKSRQALLGGWAFHTCLRYGVSLATKSYSSFAILGPSGIIEALGSAKRAGTTAERSCYDFVLQPSQSMFAAPPDASQIIFSQYIIPIESVYTLYIDAKKRLRFLGHKGNINIENQPILDHLQSLELQSSLILNGQILQLQVKVLSDYSKHKFEFAHNNHLGRTSSFNLLLNKP